MRRCEIISVWRTLLDSLLLLVNVMLYHRLGVCIYVSVCVCVCCVNVCVCAQSQLLLFIVAVFYKVTSDTGLASMEALFLKEIQE